MKRFLAALLLVPLAALAQTAPPPAGDAPEFKLTPAQVASILGQIDKAQKDISKGRGDILGKAKAEFSAAASSDKGARDLYISCYKANHFELKDSAAVDFLEWKTKNELKFKDPDFLAGVRFQLQYLILSIDALDAKELSPLIPTLETFMAQEQNAADATTKHNNNGGVQVVDKSMKTGKQPAVGRNGQPRNTPQPTNEFVRILEGSVKECEFAKAYHMDDYLTRDDWDYEPLDFGGIYSNVIFPYYRAKKPSALAEQWDRRINLEFNLQRALLSVSEYQLYWAERMPQRQWDKANDLWTNHINPVNALADMLKVIRENPTHPRAVEWAKALRELVNQSQPIVPPSNALTTSTPGDAPAAALDAAK